MIKWPDLKLPAINLWNAPRQDELYLYIMRDALKRARHYEAVNRGYAEHLESSIKEREFLYYCHSGRFPE